MTLPVPSFLLNSIGISDDTPQNWREDILRLGQVSAIYPPYSDANYNKRSYEYDVMCYIANRDTVFDIKTYRCVQNDTFGSLADRFQFTPRVELAGGEVGIGSYVMVLCAQGDTQQGVIIGAYPNPNIPPANQSEDLGHHLDFEFNGIKIGIDKDGVLTLERRGATDDNGDVISDYSDGSGAKITLSKEGNVLVEAGTSKKVSIQLNGSTGEVNLTSEGNVNINPGAGKGVVVNSGSHPIIRGDTFLSDLMSVLTPVATSVAATLSAVPATAAAGAKLQTDVTKMSAATQYLSSSKVD
jgi:hypothetical protein